MCLPLTAVNSIRLCVGGFMCNSKCVACPTEPVQSHAIHFATVYSSPALSNNHTFGSFCPFVEKLVIYS